MLLFERANRNDFSSSSIMCRELSRIIVVVGCGFGLNDQRLVAKSKPPRVNDVSNTESFSDSELMEEALIGLRTGLWILNGLVEDFDFCHFVFLAMFVVGVLGSVITRIGLNLTVEVAELTDCVFFSLVFKAFYDS